MRCCIVCGLWGLIYFYPCSICLVSKTHASHFHSFLQIYLFYTQVLYSTHWTTLNRFVAWNEKKTHTNTYRHGITYTWNLIKLIIFTFPNWWKTSVTHHALTHTHTLTPISMCKVFFTQLLCNDLWMMAGNHFDRIEINFIIMKFIFHKGKKFSFLFSFTGIYLNTPST